MIRNSLSLRVRRRWFGVIAAGAMTASMVMLGTSGTALAGARTPGQYCGVFGSGTTWTTIWTKQPPGCHDLNIVRAEAGGGANGDSYAGFYWNGHTWVEGMRGFQYIPNGNCNPNTNSHCVPLTNVVTGTKMQIGNEGFISFGFTASVQVNY